MIYLDKFLYILNQNNYIEKLKEKNIYKYIPNVLFNKLDILSEVKILAEFEYKDDIIGYTIGLTTIKNINEDKIVEKLEKLIKKNLSSENINTIIFENGYKYSLENKLMKKAILQTNNYSKEIKLKTIPFIIKKIAENFYKSEEDIELLIIYEKKEDLKKIIDKIPFKIKNIYIYKENEVESMEVSDEILKITGLSIGIIKSIDKINKFDIIINFKDDMSFINGVQERSIVFNIYNNIIYDIKKPLIVDDFIFSNKNFIMDLDFKIPSSIYNYNDKFKVNDLEQIKANGNLYSLKNLSKLVGHNSS